MKMFLLVVTFAMYHGSALARATFVVGSEAEEIYKILEQTKSNVIEDTTEPSIQELRKLASQILADHLSEIDAGYTISKTVSAKTLENNKFVCSFQSILYVGNSANGVNSSAGFYSNTALGEEVLMIKDTFTGNRRSVLARNYVCYKKSGD